VIGALKNHWPEYLIEAACLGLFMISAFGFATILEHPTSPLRHELMSPLLRRFLMGLAMGGTAIAIIYSPWGKQSGAHINPATTFTFFRLGKVRPSDAAFYIVSQFVGGALGALAAAALLATRASHPAVNYAVTAPGQAGAFVAFCAEFAIAFILMTAILHLSNDTRLHRWTGLGAGLLVAAYITFEAPLSGMSMNPARSFASALPARHWADLWIYFTAPLLGMLAAAEVYLRVRGNSRIACAKLHHANDRRCIFCGKPAARGRSSGA